MLSESNHFCKSKMETCNTRLVMCFNLTYFIMLTPCRWVMRKLVIAVPCVVDGSRVSSFPYATSCTHICQLVWRTSCFKIIDSLMQDVRSQVTNKQTGPEPLFLEPEDCNKVTTHSDTLSVYLHLQSWLCVGMFCNRTIFCVDTHSDVSDNSDNESLDSDSDVPTTSSCKQLRSSTGILTPKFPHPYLFIHIKTTFITVWD
jgi:hypothetical protein